MPDLVVEVRVISPPITIKHIIMPLGEISAEFLGCLRIQSLARLIASDGQVACGHALARSSTRKAIESDCARRSPNRCGPNCAQPGSCFTNICLGKVKMFL